jgi:hypothetical protein
LDAVQVESQGAKSGVVWIWEAVDNCVQRVSSNYIIFIFWGYKRLKWDA